MAHRLPLPLVISERVCAPPQRPGNPLSSSAAPAPRLEPADTTTDTSTPCPSSTPTGLAVWPCPPGSLLHVMPQPGSAQPLGQPLFTAHWQRMIPRLSRVLTPHWSCRCWQVGPEHTRFSAVVSSFAQLRHPHLANKRSARRRSLRALMLHGWLRKHACWLAGNKIGAGDDHMSRSPRRRAQML